MDYNVNMAKKISTIEDLARLTQRGFEDVGKNFQHVERRLDNLEQGQEDIKLRLDNVAYRFELQELEKRVKKLEFKAGIKSN